MKLIKAIMRLIGNIVWFILIGFTMGLAWLILGALWCITIIGIPCGLQCFKFAHVSFFPYGKRVDIAPSKHPVANVIWVLLFGWELAIAYAVASLFFFVTVVGIPKGIICLRLAKLALLPFGATVERQ